MAKTQFSDRLVETMKNNSEQNVYVNSDGDYLFYKRKGFDEFTREEVLGTSETPKFAKPIEKMNVEELKAFAVENGIEIPVDDQGKDLKKTDMVNFIKEKLA